MIRNIFKKIKNKFLCVLMSLILLVSLMQIPTIVYAAEPQFGSSTVTYTVDDYFYIQIPETINVGSEVEVIAMEANISPEKSIYVRIEGLGNDGHLTLQNDYDSSQTINVYFNDNTGNRYTAQNNLVAQFGTNTGGYVQSVSFSSEADADPMCVSAGSYSGQVYFDMICE